MITLEHTPGPWRVDDTNRIVDMQDRVIAPYIQGHDIPHPAYSIASKQLVAKDDGGAANAQFICRAVNGFEKLLDRLDSIELICESLLSIVEASDLAHIHSGRIVNARHILLNDPILYAPAGGGAA